MISEFNLPYLLFSGERMLANSWPSTDDKPSYSHRFRLPANTLLMILEEFSFTSANLKNELKFRL